MQNMLSTSRQSPARLYPVPAPKIQRLLTVILVLCGLLSGISSTTLHADTLRLATTTTLEESGLLSYLLPKIEQDINAKIETTVTVTRKAIRLGKAGKVDALLLHAPAEERRFVREGWGIGRYPVMKNDFLLVGPANDPIKLKGSKNLSSAFLKFTSGKVKFVSRGDQSGTHKKEVDLWNKHALFPVGAHWYYEAGEDMKATLMLANKLNAYTLVDRGTWTANQKSTQLAELYSEDSSLLNVYSVILINSNRHRVNIKESNDFLDWFLSPEGSKAIADYKINNEAPFEAISRNQ